MTGSTLENIVHQLYAQSNTHCNSGSVANYIPQLAEVAPEKFGIHLCEVSGNSYSVGDSTEKFSIQSISKVLSFALAYTLVGEAIWTRIGVEPSGTAFNSLIQIEIERGIPRNPFINAGAIVVADILLSKLQQPQEDFLNFIRGINNLDHLDYSPVIAASEKAVGYRNIALCNLMKSFGNIDNEPEAVLDFYFLLCSIEMSCQELSQLFLFLANNGISPHNHKTILSKSQTKRINALMQTCGFYDESGEFAFKVGLPGKSGVGGGIIAILPNQYSIATWSPRLNSKGNSVKGIHFLEAFTSASENSIF